MFVVCVTQVWVQVSCEGHCKDLFNSLMMCDLLGCAECLSIGKKIPSQLVKCKGSCKGKQGVFSVFEVSEYFSFGKSGDVCNCLLAGLH